MTHLWSLRRHFDSRDSRDWRSGTAGTEPASAGRAPLRPPPIFEDARLSAAVGALEVVAAGLGTTAVFYGAAVGSSYIWPDEPGMNQMRIPVSDRGSRSPMAAARRRRLQHRARRTARRLQRARRSRASRWPRGCARGNVHAHPRVGQRPLLELLRSAAVSHGPAPATPSPGNGEKNFFFLPTPMTVGSGGVRRWHHRPILSDRFPRLSARRRRFATRRANHASRTGISCFTTFLLRRRSFDGRANSLECGSSAKAEGPQPRVEKAGAQGPTRRR